MGSKKILLIGNTKSKSTQLLISAAAKKDLVFDLIPDYALVYDGRVSLRKKPLPRDFYSYDVYYFRGIARNPQRRQELHKIAQHLAQEGKRVVEKIFTVDVLPDDSEVPQSTEGEYFVPETEFIESIGLDDYLNRVSLPVVVKKFSSSQGKGVIKASSTTEIREFVADEDSFISQKFYEFPFDTRVLVIGGKVIGALNRYRKDGEDFLTTKFGGRREPCVLAEEVKKAVVAAVKQKGLEIAGVDMFIYGDKVYVIEINESPQFNVFTKTTGIDAAAHIISYLQE